MEGRGRKSVDALSVVTSIPGQRLEPPAALSEREAGVWRAIVATKPHDWFNADTIPLLMDYCRAAVAADDLAGEIRKFKKIPSGAKFARYVALRKLQDQNTRIMATLATKMRLTQQSRYTPQAASTANRRAGGDSAKPWEFGKSA